MALLKTLHVDSLWQQWKESLHFLPMLLKKTKPLTTISVGTLSAVELSSSSPGLVYQTWQVVLSSKYETGVDHEWRYCGLRCNVCSYWSRSGKRDRENQPRSGWLHVFWAVDIYQRPHVFMQGLETLYSPGVSRPFLLLPSVNSSICQAFSVCATDYH